MFLPYRRGPSSTWTKIERLQFVASLRYEDFMRIFSRLFKCTHLSGRVFGALVLVMCGQSTVAPASSGVMGMQAPVGVIVQNGPVVADYATAGTHVNGLLTRCSDVIDDVVLMPDMTVNVGRTTRGKDRPCVGPGGDYVAIPGFFRQAKMVVGTGAQGFIVKNDGSLWGWGDRTCGVLGDGKIQERTQRPVRVGGLSNVTSVATGDHFSVAVQGGDVYSWGLNEHGALGAGGVQYDMERCSNPLSSGEAVFLSEANVTPKHIPSLRHVARVVANGSSAYALAKAGTVYQWGLLPNGSDFDPGRDPAAWREQQKPELVPGLSGVVAMAASAGSAFAVRADGSLWAWGANLRSNLGDGAHASRNAPAPIAGMNGVVDVAGDSFGGVVALLRDGSILYWDGMQTRTPIAPPSGQTEICAVANRSVPPSCSMGTLPKIQRLKGGGGANILFGVDGSVYAHGAGTNRFDRLGLPTS